MISLLLQPLELTLPSMGVFFFTNVVFALACLLSSLALILTNVRFLIRPSVIFAILLHAFYQWPLTIFSPVIENTLPNAWWFAFSVHFAVVTLLLWSIFTRRLTPSFKTYKLPDFGLLETYLPVSLMVGLATIYFWHVPLECTSLYALFMDPKFVVLAREFSIKLVGSSAAVYAYGALANVVAPVAIAMAIAAIFSANKANRMFVLVTSIAIVFCAIGLVLISGAKGLLLPSLLMVSISVILWNENWYRRVLAGCLAVIIISAALVSFEIIRERDSGDDVSRYDFAACATKLDVCAKSQELAHSLYSRKMALELEPQIVYGLNERLDCSCSAENELSECPAVESFSAVDASSLFAPDEQINKMVARGTTYLGSLAYRAFVVPLQVASWHFLYVSENPSPGIKGVPFLARYLDSNSVNMPELVYQSYGSIYSDGDKTSTSTAPTGFILAYPAYLGFFGLILALFLFVGFDSVVSLIILRLDASVVVLAAGLVFATTLNFVISDFFTVLGAHGGAAAIAILLIYMLLRRKLFLKRLFDLFTASLLLAIFIIPMILISSMIRITIGPPVLFRQNRPGLDGRPFEMLKFRTMSNKWDKKGKLLPDNQRMHPLGAFLRSTSLDELPELINVIKGEMSLVGPRPLLMEYLPLYNDRQMRRHDVIPGITGWAQINGRNNLNWQEKFELDLWYVENQSFWLDIKILFKTIAKVRQREGVSSPEHVTSERFEGNKG